MGRIGAAALKQASVGELRRALSFASLCAAVTCGRPGADPPRRAELGAAAFADLLNGDAPGAR
jgi:fructokinase